MDKFFKLKENGTNVKTEVVAGITTFLAMAYIIFVNPNILGLAGMDKGAVMVATCIASALGTLLIGLLSNYPFAQAPGMGLNAFFAFTICGTLGYSWQAGLAAVFISGLVFILITVTGLREKIVIAIPGFLKKAISGGIGLFIAYIGIKNAGFLKFTIDPGNYADFDGTIVANSSPVPAFNFASAGAILAIIGLIITVVLYAYHVKGAFLISIVGTSVIGCIMQFGFGIELGITLPTGFSIASLAPTFGAFLGGFSELFITSQGIFVAIISVVAVLISLTMVDMFDTIGTLVGAAAKGGFLDKDGNLPRAGKALLADAIATSCGAVLGTSTVTTYVESSAGIAAGGKTGLTSVTTSILFLLAIVFSPVLGLVPTAATAPILIIVGVLMMGAIKDIDWHDFEVAVPAFLTVACMPLAYSIADGIAAGFIFYSLIKLFRGKGKEVSPILYVISILFIIRYFIIMM
ncbi:NCS2 family permease [Zongyangia hominis]|uniref:NCS2 family permease n=1 Tax=Zongyangia hominis TaxID=2763677 RepID=A0A926EFD4_9FIRM|nr:NCS2 family permease [Zongyangia hominis]MBC8571056.1 NCS2 family permease [Zongyangia hominis]